MWSPGSISNSLPTLNTTKVALSSLTDRCSKQQKKLEDMEREKILLRVENEQLNKSLDQFDQENLVLREKNLELSHRLERDQEQISDLQRHLDSIEFEATQGMYVFKLRFLFSMSHASIIMSYYHFHDLTKLFKSNYFTFFTCNY